ncbi:hypothetical protein PDL09_24305 [Bacillus cereus]|uniref:hypothetical protein n=1 Tax=Bacillus cereus TaxID=1396 RepID=UPI00227C44D7|nr:hypothetical protein [Bacillus cereus]MDA1850295.1 hypothetical protein [Bacillus cereus]WAI17445.1 hypothetical protein OU819_28570 [Bacillus cereus]
MIILQKEHIFKNNTYQTIVLKAEVENREIQIYQEYFKTEQVNIINMKLDECLEMDKLLKECVSDTLIKQNNLKGIVSIASSHPRLNDDENRVIKVNDTEKRSLSVQITNQFVVNVIETLIDENSTQTLKVSLKELRYILNRFIFLFGRTLNV